MERHIKLFEDFINESKEFNTSELKMVKQIKRAQEEGTPMFKLPMKTQEFYRKNKDRLTEAVNLKKDQLSSAEYQKAKKLKAFNPKEWKWNPDTDLYDKINEGYTPEYETYSELRKGDIPSVTKYKKVDGQVVYQKGHRVVGPDGIGEIIKHINGKTYLIGIYKDGTTEVDKTIKAPMHGSK